MSISGVEDCACSSKPCDRSLWAELTDTQCLWYSHPTFQHLFYWFGAFMHTDRMSYCHRVLFCVLSSTSLLEGISSVLQKVNKHWTCPLYSIVVIDIKCLCSVCMMYLLSAAVVWIWTQISHWVAAPLLLTISNMSGNLHKYLQMVTFSIAPIQMSVGRWREQ